MRKQNAFQRLRRDRGFDRTLNNETQSHEILFDFRDVRLCDTNGQVFLIADIQKFHQSLGDVFRVNPIQNIRFPHRIRFLTHQLRSRTKIVGLEVFGERAKNEPLRHILNEPVNCVCEFTGIIEGLQVAVIASVFTAVQRMLNVLANCSINVAARGFVIAERSIVCINIGIIEGNFSCTKRTTVANILVNAVNTQYSGILTKRNKCRVNGYGAVIKLLTKRKPKPQ